MYPCNLFDLIDQKRKSTIENIKKKFTNSDPLQTWRSFNNVPTYKIVYVYIFDKSTSAKLKGNNG